MASHQRSEAEVADLVSKFTHATNELSVEEAVRTRIEQRAGQFIKYAWAFGCVVAAVAIWTAKVQWDSGKQGEELQKLVIAAETARVDREASKLIFQGVRASIDQNSRELDSRKPDIDHVREMWWMKEHGISNREDFERRNGYSAPTLKAP